MVYGTPFQVFQEYYENIVLKGTSPSAMYVISKSLLFFGLSILRLPVPG